MTQTLNLVIQWLSLALVGNVHRSHKVPSQVTKEEILQIFVNELPEPSPKREAWQNA